MTMSHRQNALRTACIALVLVALAFADPALAQGGRGVFFDVSPAGAIATFGMHSGWRKTWHQIVPGDFGGTGHTDLLLYDRSNGDGKFFTTDGAGNITLLAHRTGWSKIWDLIVPGEFGGPPGTDLLFYDARNGLARFYSVSGGNLTLLKEYTDWQEWDIVLPMQLGGTSHTDLFFYSRTRGEAKFFHTDGNGNISLLKQYQFQQNWDTIVPGFFDSDAYTDLMFYHRVLGDAKFYAIDNQGSLRSLTSYTGLSPTWDLVVPGQFGGSGQTDLLFYDRAAGKARMAIVSNGVMTIQPLVTVGNSWHRIVPGRFNSLSTDDVLCYDFTHRLRIHAVRCTDANGGRAAAITPAEVQTWIDRANVVYADAGIQFDFDQETDWEVIADDTLNRLDQCKYFSTQKECDKSKNVATTIAARYPCKIVIFFRHGNLSSPTGNGFSSSTANYVALPGFGKTTTTTYFHDPTNPQHGMSAQNIKLLAHEVGHYLGIPHPFVDVDYQGFTDPHSAVLYYMATQNKKSLADMDGDRSTVYDTPPDVAVTYYLMKGWNPANLLQDIRIYSPPLGIDITFNTDRHNVMNYFGICNDYLRVSPDQARRVREWLHEAHRAKLLDTCSIPGLVKPFGVSCRAGMSHSSSGTPGLGSTITYELTGAPTGVPASLAIGLSRTSWGTVTLPFHLIAFGMPGCYAYVDQLAVLSGQTSRNGHAGVSIAVPNDSGLIGVHLYSQYLCLDPGANAAGVTVSNALDTRIGG